MLREKSKSLLAKVTTLVLILWANIIWADPNQGTPPSLGEASINMMAPVGVLAELFYNICYIVGVGFILGSIIRFKEYRENPSQTPISRPITVFIFGLVFLAVPFVAKLSQACPR